MPRVVMLARDGESTRILYHALQPALEVVKVIVEEPISPWRLLAGRRRRYGVLTAAGQLLFQACIVPLLRARSRERRREIARTYGLCGAPILAERIVRVPSANSAEALQQLRALAPEVVVVSGTRILSGDVLRAVPAPFVNVHAGITPLYRGVHGAYWAMVNGRPEHCGVTVHVVDEGIDTGPILFQRTIEPTDRDDFTTYPLLQLAAAIPGLREAVLELAGGGAPRAAPPAGPSRYWTHPTLWEYLRHRRHAR